MIGKEIYAKAVKARKKGKYERASNKQNCQEIEVVYSNQNLPKKGVIKKIRQGLKLIGKAFYGIIPPIFSPVQNYSLHWGLSYPFGRYQLFIFFTIINFRGLGR